MFSVKPDTQHNVRIINHKGPSQFMCVSIVLCKSHSYVSMLLCQRCVYLEKSGVVEYQP